MKDLNTQYGMTPPHSEVLDACETVKPCQVLDMGCSNGRNSLYLAQRGFDVTAVDNNPNAVHMLKSIIEQEKMTNIDARVYDINDAALDADYGFIICTVTLMFLNPRQMDSVLSNMRQQTLPGGYNLIVCAMDTPAYPCPINFPFVLEEGQLSTIYQDWDLLKYNEDLGTMHNGSQLQFATMLARKPLN